MIERDKMEARWDKSLLCGLPGFLAGHPVTPGSVSVLFAQTHPELLSTPSPAWASCISGAKHWVRPTPPGCCYHVGGMSKVPQGHTQGPPPPAVSVPPSAPHQQPSGWLPWWEHPLGTPCSWVHPQLQPKRGASTPSPQWLLDLTHRPGDGL